MRAATPMIPVTTFAGKRVAIFGLGKSGLISAGALIKGGAEVVVFDDNEKSLADAQSAGLKAQDLRDIDWSQIAALVLAPGVPLTHPEPHWSVRLAHKAEVDVIGDIELFCRERAAHGRDCPLVAITGTNGKSTTTALTAHLLAAAGRDVQMGGNIGVPALGACALRARPHLRLEISSYQVDLAPSLKPTVGVLLNVSQDHLDRHGTMENYAALKALVPASVEPGGSAVIGVDDRYTRNAADRIERAGRQVVRVSVEAPLRAGYYAEGSRILHAENGKAHAVAELAGIGSLRGRHNAQNAACAIADLRRARRRSARHPEGAHEFPRSRPPHAAGGPKEDTLGQSAVRQRFEGDQRRQCRQGARQLSRYFLDRRRARQDRRHCEPGRILPAHR